MKQSRIVAGIMSVLVMAGVASIPVHGEYTGARPEYVYSSHMNEQNKIALTFDDGPHPVYTPIILDILKEHSVRATFFIIGENAERYPDLVRRIQQEGHEIGNHTYLHKNLKEHSVNCICDEITHAEDAILRIAEQRTKLLRPPGGLYNQQVCDAARKLDYDIILWTVDTLDWTHPTSEEIAVTIESNIKCGDIILCHDFIGGDPSPTPDAIRLVIPRLLQRGYTFVSVSELIHSK